MKVLKGYRFRLKPNREQEKTFRRFVGMTRFVWNQALAQLLDELEKGKYITGRFSRYDIIKKLRAKPEFEFLNEAYVQTLQLELDALNLALKAYFKKIREKPRFRRKGERESFSYYQGVQVDLENSLIKLPPQKIGWVKFIQHRSIEGKCKRWTVSESCGQWFISIITEMEADKPVHPTGKEVGVDMGIAKLCALSDGTVVEPLKSQPLYQESLVKLEQRRLRLQRALSRKRERLKKGDRAGSNYLKNKRQLGRVLRKIARIRADCTHNATARITDEYSLIAIEDLKVQNMTASAKGTAENPGKNVAAKAGLNREFLNHSPWEFRRQLEYKALWKGGVVEAVSPRNTSRECPECGHIAAESRKGEKFHCVICGHQDDADINAAKNILARVTAVEETER